MKSNENFSKKELVLLIAIVSVCGGLSHFIIEWTGFTWLKFLLPCGESVFEHTKMMTYPLIFVGLYAALARRDERYLSNAVLWSLASTAVQHVTFLAYYSVLRHEFLPADIVIYYCCTIFSAYKMLTATDNKILSCKWLFRCLLVLIVVLETVFSYAAPMVWYFKMY